MPITEGDKKDHKLALILALSLTIPFVLICISLAIYFVRARRNRALETPPHYQYPYHVGFRHRPGRFFARSESPSVFSFQDQNESSRGRQRRNNDNSLYFPPPPTTQKSPLSFASRFKSQRGLRGNTMNPRQSRNRNQNQNLSPTHPSSYPRSSGGYHQPNHLSPTHYPLQKFTPLTSTEAGNPHIQQLQEAQEELAIERQRLASRIGSQHPEISLYDEPRIEPDNRDQKWIIKSYVPPEIPSATKKKYHDEDTVPRVARRKFDYDEPDDLW